MRSFTAIFSLGLLGISGFAFAAKPNVSSCPSPIVISPTANACSSATARTSCVDSTFTNPVFTESPGNLTDSLRMQPQADGTQRILLATSNANNVILLRYNLDGSPDSSFGSSGVATFTAAPAGYEVTSWGAVFDSNRNIVVLGWPVPQSGPSSFYVIRFSPDGVLDTTFASNGVFTYPNMDAEGLTIQPDNKIVIGAETAKSAGRILRLTPNGVLDGTFGVGGIVSAPNQVTGFRSVAIQTIGTTNYILASATGWFGRYLVSSGALDTTFGKGGQIAATACNPAGRAATIYVDAAGNVYGLNKSDIYLALSKYTPNGQIDVSFGQKNANGVGSTGFTAISIDGQRTDTGYSTSLVPMTDSSGTPHLLTVGTGWINGISAGILARFNLDGSLDPTFPVAAQNSGTQGMHGSGVAIDSSSGEILTSGCSSVNSITCNLGITRFWP